MNNTLQPANAVAEPVDRFPVHVFKGVTAKRPATSLALSAAQLAAQLSRVQRVARKDLAPLLTAVSYRPDAETRKIADIMTVHAVYGDIDRGFDPEAFEAGMRELDAAGVQVIAHQTYSHTAQAPRWRVYALLDEPIHPADYRACWEGLNAVFGGMLDDNAKDPGRLNYWPSCPPGESREIRTLNIAEAA